MNEKAFDLFQDAWKKICAGDFFNEENNTQFKYMLHSLWKSQFQPEIAADILTKLSVLFEKAKHLETPPPFLLILISLKDQHIAVKLQELMIFDWIKSNASEETTFQLLHLLDTFADQSYNVRNLILTIIRQMNESMDHEMMQATAHMICLKHPEFLEPCLKRFATFSDKNILKDFVKVMGRKAVLALMNLMRPAEVQKILEA